MYKPVLSATTYLGRHDQPIRNELCVETQYRYVIFFAHAFLTKFLLNAVFPYQYSFYYIRLDEKCTYVYTLYYIYIISYILFSIIQHII